MKTRAEGGLVGLLVGDALGVPYEFHEPRDLPPVEQLEMTPPPGFARAHRGVPPGTWSDDGAQALCLLASRQELDANIVRPDEVEPAPGRGSGYVVDCLRSARDCVARGTSYEQVVRAAIALGHDTDTTAAVAGGIAGIRYGLEGIPERWREALRGGPLLRPLLTGLLKRFDP